MIRICKNILIDLICFLILFDILLGTIVVGICFDKLLVGFTLFSLPMLLVGVILIGFEYKYLETGNFKDKVLRFVTSVFGGIGMGSLLIILSNEGLSLLFGPIRLVEINALNGLLTLVIANISSIVGFTLTNQPSILTRK